MAPARTRPAPPLRPALAALARALLLALAAAGLAACVTTGGRQTYSLSQLTASEVAGHDDLRFFPRRQTDIVAALDWADPAALPDLPDGRFDVLALSSGGPDGSYGAGALKGLAQAGALPRYEVVTGVSTGALIAPLIFAGAHHLPLIEKMYTDGSFARLVGPPNLFTALGGASIYPGTEIPGFMAQIVDDRLLREVAAEHARGRRLLVATANLDANELVVWNMGRIAALGTPQALELFRAVLRAAIAVPGALPPVEIASANGEEAFRELHGDAGVVAYFYGDERLVPAALAGRRHGGRRLARPRLDVILHNQIEAPARPVEATTIKLAGSSVANLARTAMQLLLDDTIRRTAEAGIDMRYAFVPTDWRTVTTLDFDAAYMRATFDLGHRHALDGALWHSGPRR